MDLRKRITAATTLMFVPGNRPDRFDKAHQAGADIVIIDLEDAVCPADRATARQHTATWLIANPDKPTVVRVNPASSVEFECDVEQLGGLLKAVMLPKSECAEDVQRAQTRFGDIPLIALIESRKGVLHAEEIALSAGVTRLAFGNVDFSKEMGVRADDHRAQLPARSTLAWASAAAQLPGPIDGVTTHLHDEILARLAAEHARTLGFAGKLCVHPKQVDAVRMAYIPTADEIAWARFIKQKAEHAEMSTIEEEPVERPVVARAKQILAQIQ